MKIKLKDLKDNDKPRYDDLSSKYKKSKINANYLCPNCYIILNNKEKLMDRMKLLKNEINILRRQLGLKGMKYRI
jgi:hypothetical protein